MTQKYISCIHYKAWIINSIVLIYNFTWNAEVDMSMYNTVTFVFLTCLHTIFLKVFIRLYMDGKWKDDENEDNNKRLSKINDELSKVCIIAVALDI